MHLLYVFMLFLIPLLVSVVFICSLHYDGVGQIIK